MEFLSFLTDSNVVTFFLLFVRFSAIFAFFPFFSHTSIPISLRTAFTFYITVLFFPLIPEYLFDNITVASIMIAVMSEILVGFMASIMLSIAFGLLHSLGKKSIIELLEAKGYNVKKQNIFIKKEIFINE